MELANRIYRSYANDKFPDIAERRAAIDQFEQKCAGFVREFFFSHGWCFKRVHAEYQQNSATGSRNHQVFQVTLQGMVVSTAHRLRGQLG